MARCDTTSARISAFFVLMSICGASCTDVVGPALDEAACGPEEPDACVRAALRYENGDQVQSDLVQAELWYARACALGSAHGCGSSGVLLFYGHGPPAQPALGVERLQHACERGYGQACSNLGIIFALGRYGAADPSRAFPLFQRGCERGSPLGCDGIRTLCTQHGSAYCDD